MALLTVLHYPDERLRKIAKPVEKVDAGIQKIVDDMFETMYDEEGIGLAATQVDIHQRIIVIDVSEERNERLVLINRNCWKNPEKPESKKVVYRFLSSGHSYRVPSTLKSGRWTITASLSSWKPAICWQFVSSMKWITWKVNYLSITFPL